MIRYAFRLTKLKCRINRGHDIQMQQAIDLTKLKIKEEVYTYKKTSFNSLSTLSLKLRKITKNKLLFLFNMYHFIDRFKGEEEEKNGLDSFNIK